MARSMRPSPQLLSGRPGDILCRCHAAALALAPSAVMVLCNDANASIECGSLDAADADRVGSAEPHGSAHPNVSGHLLRSLLEINELASFAALLRRPYYGTWRHPTHSSFRSNAPAGPRARVMCPASRFLQRAPAHQPPMPPRLRPSCCSNRRRRNFSLRDR